MPVYNNHSHLYDLYGNIFHTTLLQKEQFSHYTNEGAIFLFSCTSGKFFHVMERGNRKWRLSFINSIQNFTSEDDYSIFLDEDISPWIRETYQLLKLNIDFNIYHKYINDNLTKIKSYIALSSLT